MIIAASIIFCFMVHLYFQERHKKKVSYMVHVTERTEEAETLDFALTLFDDESMGKWAEKLERAYSIAEARRGFNNQRMIELNKRAMEAQKAEQKPTLLKKDK